MAFTDGLRNKTESATVSETKISNDSNTMYGKTEFTPVLRVECFICAHLRESVAEGSRLGTRSQKLLTTVRRATKISSATHAATAFLIRISEIRSVAALTPIFRPPPRGNRKPTWILLFLNISPNRSDSIPAEKLRFRRVRHAISPAFSMRSPECRNYPHFLVRL